MEKTKKLSHHNFHMKSALNTENSLNDAVITLEQICEEGNLSFQLMRTAIKFF